MADMDAPLLAALLRESLQKGQHPQLTITSSSMTPLLRYGDAIVLESVTIDQLEPGDILTLTTESHLQTHRYWSVQQRSGIPYLITRGDKPLSFDPLWSIESLVGRVIARQRRGKTMLLREGKGKWLNNQLNKLATAESVWLKSLSGQAAPIVSPYYRLKHRSVWFAAQLLTNIVDFVS